MSDQTVYVQESDPHTFYLSVNDPDGNPIALSGTVKVRFTKPDGTSIADQDASVIASDDATAFTAPDGTVTTRGAYFPDGNAVACAVAANLLTPAGDWSWQVYEVAGPWHTRPKAFKVAANLPAPA